MVYKCSMTMTLQYRTIEINVSDRFVADAETGTRELSKGQRDRARGRIVATLDQQVDGGDIDDEFIVLLAILHAIDKLALDEPVGHG